MFVYVYAFMALRFRMLSIHTANAKQRQSLSDTRRIVIIL